MERTRVAKIKDGKARFKYLMCPFCVAMVKESDVSFHGNTAVCFTCPNCYRRFSVMLLQLEQWKELDCA